MTSFSRRRLLDIAGSVTAASVLRALRPVRSCASGGGEEHVECKRPLHGSLQLRGNVPLRRGKCPNPRHMWVLLGYHIESGRKGEVALDGLNVVRMNFLPGHMAKGNWRGRSTSTSAQALRSARR